MMPWKAYGQMTDTELKAVWAYLQTVPAVAKRKPLRVSGRFAAP
jgi:hypothetical protein